MDLLIESNSIVEQKKHYDDNTTDSVELNRGRVVLKYMTICSFSMMVMAAMLPEKLECIIDIECNNLYTPRLYIYRRLESGLELGLGLGSCNE